jgi:putative 2OG-Fe(II) oxygenase
MDDRVDAVLDGLRERGFAKMAGVLDAASIERLRGAAARLAARATEEWSGASAWFTARRWRPAHFAGAGRNENFFDCLGLDDDFDAAVEALLARPEVEELLQRSLGADRRLWYAQLRWAVPGADEYVLHQDAYGELGLCVLLDDHPDAEGSLILWPGSNRWPRVLDALPPLRPSLVRRRLGSVDGAAGDACVFLNKTWHGRTIARDRRRLVLLLSFLPPGPVELGRRVPEATRARLGPRLRQVTDPRAGRPFGDGPPAVEPFTASFEGADRPVDPDGERAIVEYAQAACAAETCRRHARVVRDLARFAAVPRSILAALTDDFRRRSGSDAEGMCAVAEIELAHALERGDADADAARAAFTRFGRSKGEAGAPSADAIALAVRFHAELGDDAAALAAARPLLDDALPRDEDSDVLWSRVLLPLFRAGRREEAARAHALGWTRVAGIAERLDAIGRHLEYLALAGDFESGARLLRDHLPMAADPRRAGDLWHVWSGAWLLFARWSRAAPATTLLDPRPDAEGRVTPAELERDFEQRLARLAARLDQRDGGDARARRLARLRDLADATPPPPAHS